MTHFTRGAWLLHGALAVAAALAFALLSPPRLGTALLGLVLAWNLVLPLWATLSGRQDWFRAWAFTLPLSMLQLLPDAVLVNATHTLNFPDLGAPRLLGVPVYMALMWVIPLTWIVLAGSLSAALLTAAVVFGAAELLAAPLGLWRAAGVHTVAGAAIYVLPAELLLAALSWRAARGGRDVAARLGAAARISLAYTGALMWCWLLLERVGLGGMRWG